MTDREANELLKDAAAYVDIRWIPHKERLSEVSYRYLVLIKNNYERRHSKSALLPADVVSVVRCKDCKYNATTHKCLNPDSFFLIPKDDDFCSYGERREE